MELMTYKTRALRTLSLLILVALLAALNPPSLTDSVALAQTDDEPAPPVLTATADTANQVDLSWTAVTGAANYSLWRFEDTEKWVAIDRSIPSTTTSHTDTSVDAGKTYWYQVSADGESTWSNRPGVTVGAYNASTLDTPTASSTAIGLSWSTVTGADSYELWRFDTSWAPIGGTLTGTTYSDTAVAIGRTYYYQVMAKGTAGDGAWSNRVNATVPSTTPDAPQNLNAAAGNAQVVLTWNEPISNGGSAITGYQYRSQMAGGSWSNWIDTVPALSRTATVSNLTNESDYNFEVQALNANGDGPAATASAMPMSVAASIPTGLGSTSTGPTEIQLSWNAADGAASYQLQRRITGGDWGSPMDVGSGTTYTDSDLTPSTTYDYEVRAVNAAGMSAWSAVATVSTTAPTAPDAPALTAAAGADKITLTWTAPASNGADITGYDLDVSDDGSDWNDLMMPAADATSYDHMSLDPGTMNYYRIRAMNSVGSGDWSAAMMATVAAMAPGKPSLTATADGTTITLNWIAPADTGGAAITGYTIQHSNDGSTVWSNLATKAADAISHDHTGLSAGTTKYYHISARNSAGTSDWSDVASATIGGAKPPAADTDGTSPTNLRLTANPLAGTAPGSTETSILIEWDAPTTNPTPDGEDIDYEVEVWDGSTQAWGAVADDTDNDDDASDETLLDSGLMGTTEYTYRVRAVFGTSGGKGKYSAHMSKTTVAVSPAKPMLTATKMGTDKIMVSWTVSNDGGSAVIGYELQASEDNSDWTDPGYLDAAGMEQEAAAELLGAAQQSVTHMVDAGTMRYYRVRAVNGVAAATAGVENAARSEWSDVKSATTDMGAPGAPVVSINAGTPGTLAVSWTEPDNTGGSGITSYELHEWDADAGEWKLIQDSTATSYNDTGLAGNVMMYYRVRAKNANGDGPWETESATTAAGAPSAPKLTATVNGPNSITLSWTAPNNGGTDITGYTVQVSETDEDDLADANESTGAGLTDLDMSTITATHTGLSAGDKRLYRVRASNGQDGAWSNVVTVTTTTGGVPAAPSWVSDSPSATTSTTVNLEWTAPTNNGGSAITGYDIAIWDSGNWTTIASNVAPTPTEYNHDGRAGMTTYYYSVRARNANGAGQWSPVGDAMTVAGAPGKPVLTVTPDGPDKLKLSWTLDNDGGTAVASYDVQVSNNGTAGWNNPEDNDNDPDSGDAFISITMTAGEPAPAMSYVHTGLTGMTTKFYRVRADNGTNGAWSDVMSDTTPAGKPAMVTLSNPPSPELADKFVISWTAPAKGGSAITGYQIQVWEDGAWMDLMSVGGSVTSYTHEPIPGATTKYYRVRAMNAVGEGPWSATQTRVTIAGKPGAPVLNASANGTSEIRLTWTMPATGGTNLTAYQIQVSDDGRTGWSWTGDSSTIVDGLRVLQTADADSQNYTHMGLDPSTTKHYRVRAINGALAADRGPWSNVAMAMTVGGKPGMPTLTATASGTSMINLAWTPPKEDGGSHVTGYELQYWDGSNGWMALTMPAAGVTSHTHMNIAGGMTKYYRIRAMNDAGDGAWSTIAYAKTATSVPSPPTLMAMADGANKIKLTWTAGHDGGLTITDYYMQHSTNAGSSWADLGGAMSNTMMMSYTDSGLAGGTTKHYRIRAVNSKGTSGFSPLAYDTTARSVPSRPTLIASPLPNAVYLSWASPATATGGSRIIRYEVQKWDSDSRGWVDLRSTSSTAYTDTGLTNGTKYYYRVRAVNAMGDGPWSTFRHAIPAVPSN